MRILKIMDSERRFSMVYIAICDDDKVLCSSIESKLKEFSLLMSKEIEIEVFYTGKELLDYLENGAYFDLIFLDIEMPKLNGIKLGELMRERMKNETTKIVYISAKDSYAMELFDIRPMNFLVKPIQDNKLELVFRTALELISQENSLFEYQFMGKQFKVPVKNILYFESRGKRVNLIMTDETREFYGKLSDVIETINNQSFLSIHKSYLVNYGHVSEYQYETVKMSNKRSLPISQKQRKLVRDQVMKLRERKVKDGIR